MPDKDNNIFSDIPGLDNPTGLAELLNAQTQPVDPNAGIPALTQPNAAPAAQPTAEPQPTEPTPAPQTYTSEQVAQIIQNLQARHNQGIQNTPAAKPAPVVNPAPQNVPAQGGYSPQEMQFINAALSRGYSLEQIMATLNKSRTPVANTSATDARIAQIEQYLQQQQYKAEESAFINKMTAFGDKFGLSENDLVIFGNKAMEKGINLVNVPDVEMVFKAIYPEQYAIRLQRMSNTSTSQIYGGSSVPEAPRAQASKAEDAYVEAFLKHSMPNQYGMFKK